MDRLSNLLDPTWWLTILGAFATVGVLAIIFAETGLLVGFFLPGDSLLVAAGIFSSPPRRRRSASSRCPSPCC